MSVPVADLPANALLAWVRLRDELRLILGGDLVALWGYGARALPDPPLRLGDVDAFAVLRRAPSERRALRIRSAQEAIARELETVLDVGYIVARDAANPELPRDVLRQDRRYETWALHRAHWLAGRYVLLHGKTPDEVVSPPTWAELARALRLELDHLERHVAAGDDDLYETSYAILNGSRILYSLANRDVVTSKRAAGGWALEQLPARWHGAIRAAMRAYDGEATARDLRALRAAMAPFVAMVRERGTANSPTRTTRRGRQRILGAAVPTVEVDRARTKDRRLLWRLMQLYLHDFSKIDGRAINERGEFEYRWFDHYWKDPERVPLLVRVDGEWAGFALVRLGRPNRIAEFFVMPKHRRSGVGRRVAAECFARWPGRWLIHQVPGNDEARAFWRAVIPVPFEETSNTRGTTQRFEIPPDRGPPG